MFSVPRQAPPAVRQGALCAVVKPYAAGGWEALLPPVSDGAGDWLWGGWEAAASLLSTGAGDWLELADGE